jgi:adenylate cyclase
MLDRSVARAGYGSDAALSEAPPCKNRKLAAIVMADAVAFTRLVQDDERGTLAALHQARRLIATLASVHCGRVVDTAGDSILAEFPSVVGAVAAALAFQDQLAAAGTMLKFRIGVDLGDVIAEDDGTLFGDGVNRAARLQSLADAGGILVSRTVFQEVRGRLPVEFRSRGRNQLKNMRQSIACFEVIRPANQDVVSTIQSRWFAAQIGRSLRQAAGLATGGVVVLAGVAAACAG